MPAHDIIRPDADITCRAFSYFEHCEELGLVDMDPILDELGLQRSQFEAPNRITWDAWARLSDYVLEVAGAEATELSSRVVLEDSTFAGPLSAAAGMFTQPEQLYKLALSWLAPFMYRNLAFECSTRADGRVEVCARVPDGARGSLGWLTMFRGTMRVLPGLIALGESQVETLALTDRECHLLLTMPVSSSLLARIRRILAAWRSGDVVLAELAAQRAQLDASWRALEQSERSFRNALDALPAAVGLYVDQRWVYINPSLERLLGGEDRAPRELLAEEDRDLLDGGEVGPIEVRVASAGGRRSVVLATYERVSFRGGEASMLVAMDVTRRVEAEQQLARTRRTLHRLMEVNPDLILRVSREGVLLDVLSGDEHQRGEWLKDAIGQDITALSSEAVSEADVAAAREAFREAARTGARQRVEFVDASVSSYFELRVLPGDEDLIMIVRDVTRRRELEERLRQSERMASLGTLAAGVAHEINNPLSYVMTNLEIALDEHAEVLSPELRALLEESFEGAGRVRDIISRLGLFSRREERGGGEAVSLEQVAQTALRLTRHALRHQAEVVACLEEVPPVHGDARDLVQATVNLLLNAGQALEATGRFGVVELSTGVDAQGQPFLRVRDDGPGMSEVILSRVFEPFFTTRVGVGSGLGLAIVRRVMDDCGGEVLVESEPERGTAMTLRCRLFEPRPDNTAPAPQQPQPAAAPTPTAPSRPRLLVIDDDERVAALIARIMRKEFDVTALHDAAEALALLDGEGFDVIFCDLMMPGMDGMDFFARLREERPELCGRVVFVTGGAFTDGASQFLDEVSAPVVYKPFRREELLAHGREIAARVVASR